MTFLNQVKSALPQNVQEVEVVHGSCFIANADSEARRTAVPVVRGPLTNWKGITLKIVADIIDNPDVYKQAVLDSIELVNRLNSGEGREALDKLAAEQVARRDKKSGSKSRKAKGSTGSQSRDEQLSAMVAAATGGQS